MINDLNTKTVYYNKFTISKLKLKPVTKCYLQNLFKYLNNFCSMSEEEGKSNIIKLGINKVTRGFGGGSFPNGLAIILILGTIIAIILMIVFYQ